MSSQAMSSGRSFRRLAMIDAGRPATTSPVARAGKRALDIAVAGLLLALSLPVIVVVAAAIKIESRGPVFHRCWRAGAGWAPLGVVKFRKMHHGATGSPLTVSGDARLTRVGAVLAHTHLDELPQLWNVLVGQMSLVGPRPEDGRFVRLHRAAYDEILAVRPGITGWTQLAWTDEWRRLSAAPDRVRCYVETMLPGKVEMDRAYARHRRLGSDVKILLWTPLVLLPGWRVAVDPDRQALHLVRRGARSRPEPSRDLDTLEEVAG